MVLKPSSVIRCVQLLVRRLSSSHWGSNKSDRKIKITPLNFEMDNSDTEAILAPFRSSVKEQGDYVRELKSRNAPEIDVKNAVNELKSRKKLLEDKELSLSNPNITFDRAKMEDLLKQRFFYDQAFAIYGSVAGLYDFGPMGSTMKFNMLLYWRKFFVLQEHMLEVDCPSVTPEAVLKASGHVERFADLMVKDKMTGSCFRLDHLIKSSLQKLMVTGNVSDLTKKRCEDILVKLDGMSREEMNSILNEFNIKDPINGNDLSEPEDFNLMFNVQIGPTGLTKGFLRPETAQGIFVNFKRLLDANKSKIPFAAFQIGNAYRNEISPRSGLIRVREFTLAEIEHFYDPVVKTFKKIDDVRDVKLFLYSACDQMDGRSGRRISIGEALESGVISNETLGYYMARIYLFLTNVGIETDRLRFRQHMRNEMAHYALDCWDAECLTSYGWLECVGCADRSAYDLTQHSKATGQRLTAQRQLSQPKLVNFVERKFLNGLIGKKFKHNSKQICEKLLSFDNEEIAEVEKALNSNGMYKLKIGDNEFEIDAAMVELKHLQKNVHVEEFTPSVIEPSFGIGRIMYSVFEHTFRIRENDEQRTYFALPPIIAPVKCSILPLIEKVTVDPVGKKVIQDLSNEFIELNISSVLDDSSGSIGRRYTRTDQYGVPFGITVDFESLREPYSVTLRERDSMAQVRVTAAECPTLINNLLKGTMCWSDVTRNYPIYESK